MNKVALSCIGILATAIAGSQLAMAAPSTGSYQAGSVYTVTGQEPSTELSVAVLPSSSYASFTGKTDTDGQFTFTLPANLTGGEYSVLTAKGSQGYEENSSFTVVDSKRMHRSYEHEEHEHSSVHGNEHGHGHSHGHADHPNPQQTYGTQILGIPYGGYGGGYGKESITAIAANSAGTSASAKIGLVSLAGLLGAVAFF